VAALVAGAAERLDPPSEYASAEEEHESEHESEHEVDHEGVQIDLRHLDHEYEVNANIEERFSDNHTGEGSFAYI
jgi:hypothetical protein